LATLPNLKKGITKDAFPPATDTQLTPISLPNGTTILTTKLHNEIVDNEDQIIDYISGDNGTKIPQSAIDSLVSDLAAKEDVSNKGANSGYAGLDATSKLQIANFPSGNALQVLRRDAANTALEFATPAGLTFAKVVKSVDETRTNLSSTQDDDELFITLDANTVYSGILVIFYDLDIAAGLKRATFSIPFGATGILSINELEHLSPTGITELDSQIFNGGQSGLNTTSAVFTITTGGTPGNITFQWSPAFVVANNVTIKAGSYMVIWKT